MMNDAVSAPSSFLTKKWATTGVWFRVLFMYSWFSANFTFPQTLLTIRKKRSELLENAFLSILAFDWPRSAVEVFLNNSLENLNLPS